MYGESPKREREGRLACKPLLTEPKLVLVGLDARELSFISLISSKSAGVQLPLYMSLG
jgi:hypothetical protein